MFRQILRRRRLSELRRTMRGYRKLKASGSLGYIDEVCSKLLLEPLQIESQHFSRHFYGAGTDQAEIITRQYLHIRNVLYRLPNRLLAHFGDRRAIAYPLPRQWQNVLENHGFQISRFRCTSLWLLFLGFYYCFGILTILKLFTSIGRASFRQRYAPGGPFTHFEQLTVQNLPRPASDGRSYDAVSWYLQWPGRGCSPSFVTHRSQIADTLQSPQLPVIRLSAPCLPPTAPGQIRRFTIWALRAALGALADLARGRWWHALILAESAVAALVRGSNPEQLAKDYMLHNSGWLYRPLWTYEAEELGSRIVFYHYSTNSEGFKRPGGYAPHHYSWRTTTWPLHLAWDTYHADFIRRAVSKDTNVEIVGPIWFASGPELVPEMQGPAAAVFDVQPFRPALYQPLAFDFDYFTADICNAFLADVAAACAQTGLLMAWKRKRNIGKNAHPRYRTLATVLATQDHIHPVPADISAYRLIEACDFVISLPFTSTALIGRHMNKPSCYYDASGTLQKDDRGAHGIPIIQAYDELVAWIRNAQREAMAAAQSTSTDGNR